VAFVDQLKQRHQPKIGKHRKSTSIDMVLQIYFTIDPASAIRRTILFKSMRFREDIYFERRNFSRYVSGYEYPGDRPSYHC
jgi:hypothetical protein